MLELLHAVLTSLLLSAGLGCGAGQAATGEDKPVDPENGVDIGSMPSYLASLRGPSTTSDEAGDDDLPASLTLPTCLSEPTAWVDSHGTPLTTVHPEIVSATSGRSP